MSKQMTNRFEAVSCDACGRKVKRKSRQQRYCSYRCRDFARRENNARTAIKNFVLGQDTAKPTDPLKLPSKNNGVRGTKSASSIPFNVLGGHRWQNAISIDPAMLRNIVRREIGGES